MNVARLATLAAALALASSGPATSVDGPPIDLCQFELAFADEFDTMSISPRNLDGKRWTAHTPWNGDFGDAYFGNPDPDGPFSLGKGTLRITASRDSLGRWRSGLIAAAEPSGKGSGEQYGYFEARMKIPPGPGTWPAFWLISLQPADSPNPKVEIDVVEYYGQLTDKLFTALHIWFPKSNEALYRNSGKAVPIAPGSLVDRFHTYGVRVQPDWITYYLDRVPIHRERTPAELQTPLYPLVNLALGSGYPIDKTPDPSVLEVDYVRVYRDAPSGGDKPCAAPTVQGSGQ